MTPVQTTAARADERLVSTIRQALEYARERDYVGYDKHDGLSSRFRRALPIESKWLNLAFQESVKRAPVNLRPLLLVEQRAIPKGDCLFAMANMNAYEITGESQFRAEARRLLSRVRRHDEADDAGFGIGYSHPLQTLSQTIPAGVPDIVATSYGVRALVQAAQLGIDSPDPASAAATFVETELPTDTTTGERRTAYKPRPFADTDSFTINANALAARLYADLYDQFGDERYRQYAKQYLTYVADRQESSGGWYYTDPPAASHLSMDSYHNGFILESLLRYQKAVGGEPFGRTLADGLSFYETLFEPSGAPHWDESNRFPRDVHAAAQGIVVFSLAGDLDRARSVVDWTIDALGNGDGQFHYQQTRYYTKRFTLMRWSQAWMAYALSTYVRRTVSS